MAYEPKVWQCGEVVSAEALNHLEQGVADASQGGGGCDCGYECTDTLAELFNGSLTTESQLGFYGADFTSSQPIEGESIVVTLNGTDYTLPKVTTPLYPNMYGEADADGNPTFTNYPCAVMVFSGVNSFVTPSAGTYQVIIKAVVTSATTSDCFDKAVQGSAFLFVNVTGRSGSYTTNKTFEDIANAIEKGRYPIVILKDADYGDDPRYFPYYGYNNGSQVFSHFYYEPENEGAEYTDPPRITATTVYISDGGTVRIERGIVEQKHN